MKLVLDDIVTSFTDRPSSHRSAWPRMQKCMLEDYNFVQNGGQNVQIAFGEQDLIKDTDYFLVSTPMEFKGEVFNLFGGYTLETRNRIARVLDMDLTKIKALEKPIPDIEKILRPRSSKTDFDFSDLEWDKIRSLMDCEVWTHEKLVTHVERVVLGDSHSISRYRKNTIILRHDGLTMHGLTQRGVHSYLDDYAYIPHLVINVGNVDIRHHLMRQDEPMHATRQLVTALRIQLEELQNSSIIGTYEVTAPYPIEFEGRKIPKTGYYKGTPFYGNWAERDKIRTLMQMEMRYQFENVHLWPIEWYLMNPEDYAKLRMEKPGSVHLSPEFYEWDLFTNKENDIHGQTY